MRILLLTTLAFTVVLSGTVTMYGQTDLKPREGTIIRKKDQEKTVTNQMLRTLNINKSNMNDATTRVAEHVSMTTGPIGELYLVAGVNEFIKVDPGRQSSHIYPSLIFDLSASPLLKIGQPDKKGKYKLENTDYNLVWRDVTVTISATCKRLDAEGATTSEYPCNEQVSVIEVLPNKTDSGLKDSAAAQFAAAVSGLGTAAAPFFPASTFNEKVAAAGDGLTVLFRNLFPPTTKTYFHAFMGDDRTFGWNFHENKEAEANPSILGLERGIVLLKVSKDVIKIDVHCDVLSKWNKDLEGGKGPFNWFSDDWMYVLPAKKGNPTDYDSIVSLKSFPFLIHKGDLLNILHLIDAAEYDNMKRAWKLKDGEEMNSVTKESVRDHLASMKLSPAHIKQIIAGYPDSISKHEVVQLICRYDGQTCPSRKIPREIKQVGDYAQRSSVEEFLGIADKEKEKEKEKEMRTAYTPQH